MTVTRTGQPTIQQLCTRMIDRPATKSNEPWTYTTCADVLAKISRLIDSVIESASRVGPSRPVRCFECATATSFLRPRRVCVRKNEESRTFYVVESAWSLAV